MFVVRQLFQKSWAFDKEVHTLFVDFRKSYGSIQRKSLLNIMKTFNFPHKLVNLVSISVMDKFVRVQVGNTTADPITVNSGLKQGDSLSLILYIVVLEKVIRGMNIIPQEGIRLKDRLIS